MKATLQFFILLSFLFIQNNSSAQSDLGFAPVGAKWYYTFPPFYSGDFVSYIEFEVTSDTIINGKSASVIYRNSPDVSRLTNPFFLHYDSNRVYWYNQYSNDFHLLYDFNAEAGDGWFIKLPCDSITSSFQLADSIYMAVTSTDSIIVNNTTLKRLFFNNQRYTIIEKVGMLYEGGYPNSEYYCDGIVVDPTPTALRCYEDSALGLFKGPDPDDCDTIYINVGLNDDIQYTFSIHPNPANKNLSIESDKVLQEVMIKNLSGQILLRKNVEGLKSTLDIGLLPDGLYLVTTISESGIKKAQKVIIQHL